MLRDVFTNFIYVDALHRVLPVGQRYKTFWILKLLEAAS